MFKLVILTEVTVTERALEDPSSMVPHTSLALQALSVCQWACAGMGGQAFAAVAYPPFTEVTYGTLYNIHMYVDEES